MTVYLIPNLTKPQAAPTAAAAVDVLCAQGARVILPADVPPEPFAGQIATIRELYNSVCGSYPRLEKMSEARKRAIRARLRAGYTVEDFQRLFEMAEASDFLKGKNGRNWSATFDWLTADANMAKVLDGNYVNRGSAAKESEEHADRRPASDFYKQFLPGAGDGVGDKGIR